MKNKKGFTLIELLAVIVILGILMLIAIPSVTKYIETAKKETYIKSIMNMVDAIKYDIISGTGKYSMEGREWKAFSLKSIELEKGSNKSPFGDLDNNYSYVLVSKNGNEYKYEVQVKDESGYVIPLTNIDNLNKEDIKTLPDNTNDEENDGNKDIIIEAAPEYEIGDQVTFAGSNWYVIKKSTVEEDYVTLLKEKVLTNAELGTYAATSTYNVMSYYWNDACHTKGYYGYTDTDESGCKNQGYNNYETSKIKEFLEGPYINNIGSNNLKEVDGYKVRLITLSELQDFGYDTTLSTSSGSFYAYNSIIPQWIHENYGENITGANVGGYWTMSVNPKHSYSLWRVNKNKNITNIYVSHISGVRPVINLLKNSIK